MKKSVLIIASLFSASLVFSAAVSLTGGIDSSSRVNFGSDYDSSTALTLDAAAGTTGYFNGDAKTVGQILTSTNEYSVDVTGGFTIDILNDTTKSAFAMLSIGNSDKIVLGGSSTYTFDSSTKASANTLIKMTLIGPTDKISVIDPTTATRRSMVLESGSTMQVNGGLQLVGTVNPGSIYEGGFQIKGTMNVDADLGFSYTTIKTVDGVTRGARTLLYIDNGGIVNVGGNVNLTYCSRIQVADGGKLFVTGDFNVIPDTASNQEGSFHVLSGGEAQCNNFTFAGKYTTSANASISGKLTVLDTLRLYEIVNSKVFDVQSGGVLNADKVSLNSGKLNIAGTANITTGITYETFSTTKDAVKQNITVTSTGTLKTGKIDMTNVAGDNGTILTVTTGGTLEINGTGESKLSYSSFGGAINLKNGTVTTSGERGFLLTNGSTLTLSNGAILQNAAGSNYPISINGNTTINIKDTSKIDMTKSGVTNGFYYNGGNSTVATFNADAQGAFITNRLTFVTNAKMVIKTKNLFASSSSAYDVLLNVGAGYKPTMEIFASQKFGNVQLQTGANMTFIFSDAGAVISFNDINQYSNVAMIFEEFRNERVFFQNLSALPDFCDFKGTSAYGDILTKEDFSLVAGTYDGMNGYWLTANIIPEPAEWAAIFGAIALGFAVYRRRK